MFQHTPDILPAALPADSVTTVAREVSEIKTLSLDELINRMISTMVEFAIHLAIAIFVFYVGKFLIRKLFNVTASLLLRRKVDRSLSTFILSLVRMVLYFILIVTVIGILGINTSSFIALFASAGVAVGMALSGTLQNFAGGVLILLLKPYKVGDYIEAQGFAGTITEIQIFHTIISTYDNKAIIIPNGGLSTGSINNWSREDFRRVSWDISISYGDDFDTARKVIVDMLLADDRVIKSADDARRIESEKVHRQHAVEDIADEQLADESQSDGGWLAKLHLRRKKRIRERIAREKALEDERMRVLRPNVVAPPQVYISNMADSSIQLSVRAWVRTPDYWAVFYHFNEMFYKTLPQHSLSFPFPQLDVHVTSSN